MVFAKKEILLKDGRACILRPAQASDAQAMLDYLRAVSAETPFLLRGEEEITDTLESEERLLEQKREDPREMMMVAEADGWIAGNCAVLSYGSPRRGCPPVRLCHRGAQGVLGAWPGFGDAGLCVFSGANAGV